MGSEPEAGPPSLPTQKLVRIPLHMISLRLIVLQSHEDADMDSAVEPSVTPTVSEHVTVFSHSYPAQLSHK